MPKRPVDFDQLYPSRFLKAGDFQGRPVTLEIADVQLETLEGEKGPEEKALLFFQKTDKQMVLNKTNGICIRAMFGRKVAEWIGHKVTFFPGTWNGEPAIRVWGSPELTDNKVITVQLPRRRPFEMTLHAMKSKSEAAPEDKATPF